MKKVLLRIYDDKHHEKLAALASSETSINKHINLAIEEYLKKVSKDES
jgi:predicted HicB family RNase H-like nuclease